MVFDSSAGHVNLRAYSLFNQAMHSIHAKAIAFAAKTCTNLLCKYVYKLKHINFKCVCVCRYGKYAHSLIFIHFANFTGVKLEACRRVAKSTYSLLHPATCQKFMLIYIYSNKKMLQGRQK